jgi:aspartyl-tRNA(Asn)/glutamyl-tRNA(Gln) amidotransferase subunit A
MNQEELCFTPATELARMIRGKSISPVEIMQATLARAQALNPRLNAICTATYESAMQAARAAETAVMRGDRLGVLHGVPTTIKDLALTKGVRTMAGSYVFRDRVPDFDHLHVERMRTAGAISIGKTTVSEFGWKGNSNSPLTGITHNPWKHGGTRAHRARARRYARPPGSARSSRIRQGRFGAYAGAFCSAGSNRRTGASPTAQPNNGLISHVGPLTRTVADAALMLTALAGPDDRDVSSLEAQPEDFLGRLDDGIAGLRVAYSPNLGYLRVDPEVAAPVKDAALAFEKLGGIVEEVDPGWGDVEMEHCHFASNFAASAGPLLEKWADKMDPGLVALTRHGMTYSAADYCKAQGERLSYYDNVRAFFERYDLLLTPSLSVAAFPAELLIPSHWEQHPGLACDGLVQPSLNLTGLPRPRPCGFTPGGLPSDSDRRRPLRGFARAPASRVQAGPPLGAATAAVVASSVARAACIALTAAKRCCEQAVLDSPPRRSRA